MAIGGLFPTSAQTCHISIMLLVVAFQQYHPCQGTPVTSQPNTTGKDTTDITTRSSEEDYSIEETEEEKLKFHSYCGSNAVVSHDRRTVRTLNDDDDEGLSGAITNRPLRVNESFEIVHRDRTYDLTSRTEYIFDMGVTNYSADDLKEYFPSRMAEIESGNWIPNWTIPVDLEQGDYVGITLFPDRTLHVFVNDIDLGEVATEVPDNVYGYVEIYSGTDIEISIVESGICKNEGFENMTNETRRWNELRCFLGLG